MPRKDSFIDLLFGRRNREIKEEIGRLGEEVQVIKEKYHDFNWDIRKIYDYVRNEILPVLNELHTLKEEVHSHFAIQSLGIDTNAVPLYRFLPIRVYLTEADRRSVGIVSEAITKFYGYIEFEISDSFPPEGGSFWKKWIVKSKDAITQPEVLERLQKAERALELATLQKYQAEVDKQQADAAGTLLQSLKDVPNAVCQIGSILIIKVTDSPSGPRVFTRSLTTREMIYLERNQHLLREPQTILESLAQHCREEEGPSPADNNLLEP